jgi:addiction module HigA family antidote
MRIRTHPGEVLQEEFLKPFRMSASALAAALQVPANRISDIVRGRRDMTADTAMRLSRYFGTSAEFWLNLQTAYDLSKVAAERGKEIARTGQAPSERGLTSFTCGPLTTVAHSCI